MRYTLALAVCGALLAAAPALATSLQIWEDSLGAPGVTAQFGKGTGFVADLDLDASTAEGGGLLFGATEITLLPLGDVVFTGFVCSFVECSATFTPGGAGTGQLVIDDTGGARNGTLHLGDLSFDGDGFGSILLDGCSYTSADSEDRNCAPFTVATVPEPGAGALLALGLGGLAWLRRRTGAPLAALAALSLPLATLASAPAGAAALQVWESTLGAPGITASYGNGAGLSAQLSLDASSAEGGGLLVGATEIELRPSGSVQLVGFSCDVPGCVVDFAPGGEGEGARLQFSDPDPQPQNGVVELGTLTFDAPSDGGLHLIGCHYIGQDATERRCGSFQVLTLPEPGSAAALAAGAALLLVLRRRRR